METRNCPNCGAAIDTSQNKCPYCGTSYFDLACIPINEPFYLRINVGTTEKPRIVCQKVVTAGVSAEYYPSSLEVTAGLGNLSKVLMHPQTTAQYHFDFVSL